MSDIAHLSFKTGGLILPVRTPYERELMIEHVESATKRHGRVLLEVDRRHWEISTSNGLLTTCAACSQWPDDLNYPGGASGALSVVSSRAMPCVEITCELALVGAHV
jgi:hypothetical protein